MTAKLLKLLTTIGFVLTATLAPVQADPTAGLTFNEITAEQVGSYYDTHSKKNRYSKEMRINILRSATIGKRMMTASFIRKGIPETLAKDFGEKIRLIYIIMAVGHYDLLLKTKGKLVADMAFTANFRKVTDKSLVRQTVYMFQLLLNKQTAEGN